MSAPQDFNPEAAPISPEEAQAATAAEQADAAAAQVNEIESLKAQNAELAEQYLRAKAEVENIRRRSEDEIAKTRKFALESFAESLLPVLDSLEAGLRSRKRPVAADPRRLQATLK